MKDVPLILTVASYNTGMFSDERIATAKDLRSLTKPQRIR